ncbi:MAG TPA: hypothetical protein DFS52_05620 [Myxococcales bacterium]|jgi:hypothetical protein|nr:hypothetical protein [Myxococcales bacterium]
MSLIVPMTIQAITHSPPGIKTSLSDRRVPMALPLVAVDFEIDSRPPVAAGDRRGVRLELYPVAVHRALSQESLVKLFVLWARKRPA